MASASRLESRGPRCLRAGARALGKAFRHAEKAVRRAGGALMLPGLARPERLDRLVVAELSARLREQSNVRRPAAGDGEEVAFDLTGTAAPPPCGGRTAMRLMRCRPSVPTIVALP